MEALAKRDRTLGVVVVGRESIDGEPNHEDRSIILRTLPCSVEDQDM